MRAKNRRNYIIAFAVAVVSWIVFGVTLFFIEPGPWWSFVLIFVSLFAAFFLTLSLVFGHTRRGLMIGAVVVGLLLLRLFGLDNIVNIVLIAALVITIEVFFWQK